jgi:hypothetical protein
MRWATHRGLSHQGSSPVIRRSTRDSPSVSSNVAMAKAWAKWRVDQRIQIARHSLVAVPVMLLKSKTQLIEHYPWPKYIVWPQSLPSSDTLRCREAARNSRFSYSQQGFLLEHVGSRGSMCLIISWLCYNTWVKTEKNNQPSVSILVILCNLHSPMASIWSPTMWCPHTGS